MIEYKNLTISFKDNLVFKEVNLEVKRKSIILGPNGSGKTTLIRATCGLIPYSGYIYVDGNEVRNIRNYLPLSTNLQEVYNLGIRVKDIVYLFEEIKDLDKGQFESFLKEVKLLEQVINKPLFKLSAGQSQIVRLALALASKPKIVLLDEPFENLDPARRATIVNWIKEYVSYGLITTHELDLLKEFKDWDSYFLFNGKFYGPVKVEDLIEASVVEGEVDNAIITIEVSNGKRISLVRGEKGAKLVYLGNINRIYSAAL